MIKHFKIEIKTSRTGFRNFLEKCKQAPKFVCGHPIRCPEVTKCCQTGLFTKFSSKPFSNQATRNLTEPGVNTIKEILSLKYEICLKLSCVTLTQI